MSQIHVRPAWRSDKQHRVAAAQALRRKRWEFGKDRGLRFRMAGLVVKRVAQGRPLLTD